MGVSGHLIFEALTLYQKAHLTEDRPYLGWVKADGFVSLSASSHRPSQSTGIRFAKNMGSQSKFREGETRYSPLVHSAWQ